LLEDFDHLYRFSTLFDRIGGGDANNIIQSYSDIREDPRSLNIVLRTTTYATVTTGRRQPPTKLHANTIMAGEHQTHDYYMTIGPMFADPLARQLYAEIPSIEEQHVTQYESIIDPDESWLEKVADA
jgi:hypothetical protein